MAFSEYMNFNTEKLFLAHISSKEKLLANDTRFVMMPQSYQEMVNDAHL